MDRREAIKRTTFLLGGTLSASAVAGVLSGCQPSLQPDWEPQVLSAEQALLVGGLVECILPATDTPGAKELGVDEFIDLMLKDAFPTSEQEAFKSGLEDVEKRSLEAYGRPFLRIDDQQQTELLTALDKAVYEETRENGSTSFFRTFKELTLLGYFTSERVMNEQLNFNPVPGAYKGCIEIGPDEPAAVDLNV